MAAKRKRSSSSDGARKDSAFDPRILDKATIAPPLLVEIERRVSVKARKGSAAPEPIPVIIDVNLDHAFGRDKAQAAIWSWIKKHAGKAAVDDQKTELTQQYVFADLLPETILALVDADKLGKVAQARKPSKKGETGPASSTPPQRAIYRIWPDFPVEPHTTRSWSTVKADAAHRSFLALGDDIVWGVIDSGIDAKHEHFVLHDNLSLPAPLDHHDFTKRNGDAKTDGFGHGTHVAGIIAGENGASLATGTGKKLGTKLKAATRRRSERTDDGVSVVETTTIDAIRGMAPKCKLMSLKALDDNGAGRVSNIIAALAYVQKVNSHGRRIRVHGVNVSVGYSFDAEWFACGQSPLCVEIDRLVKSGVCVVVAAGNTGYGDVETDARGPVKTPMALSINDPGNAELAITVGSTHRDMPHVYGVSYFSSKGPTGDGRAKPDVVAPGEKIISCAAGAKLAEARGDLAKKSDANAIGYLEDSGTSMAAPHVSGVIAAFLSVRREFVGRPEEVKRIFLESATDLRRERYFQGHGLVDLMRAIQSV